MSDLARIGFALPAPRASVPSAEDVARAQRRELVRQTWSEVPSHQLKWRTAPEFEQAVNAWVPDRGLILLGPTGSGKTSAAVRLVARLCRLAVERGGPWIVPARSLCWANAGKLTRAGAGGDDDARELIRRCERVKVLVLDDFAATSKTIQETIVERRAKGLPTVLTSGCLTRDQLIDALGGDAVYRQLTEATGKRGTVVIFGSSTQPGIGARR